MELIKKMNNKEKKFYQYMGKFFGSRIVEKQTNDRIYDDDNKMWYVYQKDNKIMAFVSITNNVIKNIYTLKPEYLGLVLNRVKQENSIGYSIVTSQYVEIYEECGFKISKDRSYKNFVTIYLENSEEAIA